MSDRRQPLMSNLDRSEKLAFRLRPRERELIERAAEWAGKRPTVFARLVVRERARDLVSGNAVHTR